MNTLTILNRAIANRMPAGMMPDNQRRAMFARQRMSGAPPAPRDTAPPTTATTRALAAAVAAVRAGETVDRESNTTSRKIPTLPRERPAHQPQRPGRLPPGPGYIDHDAWRQGADKRGLPISAPSRR